MKKYFILSLIGLCLISLGMINKIETTTQAAKNEYLIIKKENYQKDQQIDSLKRELANNSCCN
jgi:hypothetical protein